MSRWVVIHLWGDDQGRDYSTRKEFETEAKARSLARELHARSEGEVWIEEQGGARSRPVITNPKGSDEPMTPEHWAQLRESIRSLQRKTVLDPEEVA